jgi:hypothetical protein
MVWQNVRVDDNLDAARRSASALFHDDRVRHIWDEKNVIGSWYKIEGKVESQISMVWDAYYLYTAESTWDSAPTHLIGCGYPVVDMAPAIKRLLSALPSEPARKP